MPSPEMREAMITAPLGDDVFGDDPTTNKLMEVAAARMGKDAATFVPSGTMGNLIGIAVNARSGQELSADADSHAFYYETAGAAAVCGVQIRPVATEGGVMSPRQVEDAVRPRDDPHQPITAAITFENTHNRHGGIVWPLDALRAASDAARAQGLRVHLDGARIFNAAVALDVQAAETAARAPPLPVGTLAEGIAELPGVKCDLGRVQTNLVYFELDKMPAPAFTDECARRGLLSDWIGPRRMRFVTHYGIGVEDVQSAVKICEEVLS